MLFLKAADSAKRKLRKRKNTITNRPEKVLQQLFHQKSIEKKKRLVAILVKFALLKNTIKNGNTAGIEL